MLGLADRAKQRISTLSGGQRKRTSVALELLTEPSLLCLDEPTSGLDPSLDREVMRELRSLADRGRTVVVVTHSVLHLSMCDRVLVMCLGGRMGFFGPPDEVLDFFGAEDYADVFEMITNDATSWSHALPQLGRVPQTRRRGGAAADVAGAVAGRTTGGAAIGPATGRRAAAPPAIDARTAPVVPAQPGPADVADSAEVLVLATPATRAGHRAAASRRRGAGRSGTATAGSAGGSAAGRAVATRRQPQPGRAVPPVLHAVGSDDGGDRVRTAATPAFLLGLPLILALLTHAVPGQARARHGHSVHAGSASG